MFRQNCLFQVPTITSLALAKNFKNLKDHAKLWTTTEHTQKYNKFYNKALMLAVKGLCRSDTIMMIIKYQNAK